ncbi:glycoside hydrolase domain-containing protein, partial [Streptomyces sp. NPDC006622]
MIYMYDAAGQPWKAQARVREALARLYTGSAIG